MISRENLVFAVAAFAGVVLLFTIGLWWPHLLVEDGLVENLSALGFAAASLLALGTALRGGASLTTAEKWILIGTSGLSLLLFLSEISFGARILGIHMPEMPGGGKFDGGHDVVILGVREVSAAGSTGMLLAVAVGALLLAAAIALLRRYRQQARQIVATVLSRAFEFRLAVAAGMLASAVTLDLIPSYKASTLEEVLEFSAGIVLILAVCALLRREVQSGVFGSQVRGYPSGGIACHISLSSREAAQAGEARRAARR